MIKFYIGVNFKNGIELETKFYGTGEEIAKTIALGIAFFEEKSGCKNATGALMEAVNKAYENIDIDMRKALVEGVEKC